MKNYTRCAMCDEWYYEFDPASVKAHQHPEPQSGPPRDAWIASRMPYELWIIETPEGREWNAKYGKKL